MGSFLGEASGKLLDVELAGDHVSYQPRLIFVKEFDLTFRRDIAVFTPARSTSSWATIRFCSSNGGTGIRML
jgi:hypothetical protein